MRTLYELSIEWELLLQDIEDSQGMLSPTMEQRLNDLIEGSKEKIDNSLDVLASLEAMEGAQKLQADRMRKRSQQTGKAASLLRERIQGAIAAMGGKHVSDRWQATLTTGRPAIRSIFEETADPIAFLERHNPQFVRTEIKKSLDLEALGKLSDTELELLGFRRVQKPFLRIS